VVKRLYKIIISLPVNKIALLLFLVSFVLRFAYAFYAYQNNIMESFSDDMGYFLLAEKIVAEGKILYSTDLHLYAYAIGPGLPWINALTIILFGHNWLGVFFVTSNVMALVTVFTYLVANKVVNKPTSILVGVWSCFYLFYFKFSPTAGKDAWMSLFLILIIYLVIIFFNKNNFSYPKLILLAFIYTYSFHLDERFFLFAPFIVFYLLLHEAENFTKFCFTKSIIFTLMIFLFMVPWAIRNYVYHDKIVIISSRTERLTDKIFGYTSRQFPWDDSVDFHGRYYIYDYQIDSVINGTKTITNGGYPISEQQRQAMIKGNMPRPFKPYEAFWVRTKSILRPFQIWGEYQKTGYFYYKKSLRHNLASLLFYGSMFFFSFPGFYYLYRRNRNTFYLFLTTIIVYTLIHSLFVPWTTWRYRLPLDSIFIIVGCYGITNIYRFLKSNRSLSYNWQ